MKRVDVELLMAAGGGNGGFPEESHRRRSLELAGSGEKVEKKMKTEEMRCCVLAPGHLRLSI